MRKKDVIIEIVKDEEWFLSEMHMYLKNNYGSNVQYLYDLVDVPREDWDGNFYKKLTKKDARELKHYIFNSCMDIIRFQIKWQCLNISDTTIKNTLKEIGFFKKFNELFLNNLNGEDENIEELRKVIK